MRVAPPDLPGAQSVDSPLDRALALLLAGEREAALRWSAAVVQQDASVSSALILTCRLLADAGRTEAAIEGFELGVKRAVDTGNLPLAVAALGDLKKLGVDVSPLMDDISSAFCAGSPRLADDAHLDPGVRLQVEVPGRVGVVPAATRDDDVRLALTQRRGEQHRSSLAALAAGRGELQGRHPTKAGPNPVAGHRQDGAVHEVHRLQHKITGHTRTVGARDRHSLQGRAAEPCHRRARS